MLKISVGIIVRFIKSIKIIININLLINSCVNLVFWINDLLILINKNRFIIGISILINIVNVIKVIEIYVVGKKYFFLFMIFILLFLWFFILLKIVKVIKEKYFKVF